jgi:hypothetical protein
MASLVATAPMLQSLGCPTALPVAMHQATVPNRILAART